MSKLKSFASIFLSLGGAALYGLFIRVAFALENELAALLAVLSVAFLMVVPLGIGVLTVLFAPAQLYRSWVYAVFGPWIACLIFTGLAAVLTFEAWICVVMAAPILLTASTIGGVLTNVLLPETRPDKPHTSVVGVLLILPFILLPIEQQFTIQ
ncbi:MAG: hypothetical protein R3264_19650, partial [Anaerolineae bacterium]|nr:hypothetical protein [Anaerolineae bacterium]